MTAWRKFDVVLDVPATATGITYRLVLVGKGRAWFDGVTLEPVERRRRNTSRRAWPRVSPRTSSIGPPWRNYGGSRRQVVGGLLRIACSSHK
jgi:hypothetical protein